MLRYKITLRLCPFFSVSVIKSIQIQTILLSCCYLEPEFVQSWTSSGVTVSSSRPLTCTPKHKQIPAVNYDISPHFNGIKWHRLHQSIVSICREVSICSCNEYLLLMFCQMNPMTPARRCSRLMESCAPHMPCCDPCASCRCRLFNTICHCWKTNSMCKT